jgi:16S rRNA (guanine527-N7)-methyltransferase
MSPVAAARSQGDLGTRIHRGLAALGLSLDSEQENSLLIYITILRKWNQVYNLTAIREPEKMVSAHLLDSLAIVPHVRGRRLLDVGSGAGLPGIPVAIAKPECDMTLLDSNHKKAAFLRQAVAELRLKNVKVVCERVETWRPAEKFDCIMSRALSELVEFVSLTKHLLAPGGAFAAMKGVSPDEEILGLPRDVRVQEVLRLAVPGLAAERHLVLIESA